jgi:type IV pilus assembly protein PilM
MADAMRRVVKKSGTRTKNVAMALPPSAVITKKIILPGGLTDQELEVQVEAEANQYIPFSLDEVSLDFCVIGPSPTSVGDVEVLIAASRKDRVQDRQGLAEAAGLKPAVLDIESHASRLAMSRVVASLPNEGRDALVALFEIGADLNALGRGKEAIPYLERRLSEYGDNGSGEVQAELDKARGEKPGKGRGHEKKD